MAQCVTCGAQLHPERAKKYNYCMARECQEKNARPLTIAAVGMNKAAEEFFILDDRTRSDLASGKYRDQRRELFGPAGPAPAATAHAATAPAASAAHKDQAAHPGARQPTDAAARSSARRPADGAARPAARPGRKVGQGSLSGARRGPWTRSQEKLALLYNEQGLRPDEIAGKLGLSPHLVTQIILAARNKGKN